MKIEIFSYGKKRELAELLSDENISVKKVFLSPTSAGEYDLFYVFYEEAEEQLKREKDELSKLNKIAIDVEKDEGYKLLKNATQRELFLLQEYNIPSAQAKKTIELLNMRKIVVENGLSRLFEKGVESGDIKIAGAKE